MPETVDVAGAFDEPVDLLVDQDTGEIGAILLTAKRVAVSESNGVYTFDTKHAYMCQCGIVTKWQDWEHMAHRDLTIHCIEVHGWFD